MEGKTGKAGLDLMVGGFKCWPSSWGSFIGGPGESGRISREESSRDIVTETGRFPLGSHQKVILLSSHQSPHLRGAGGPPGESGAGTAIPARSGAGPFLCAPVREEKC